MIVKHVWLYVLLLQALALCLTRVNTFPWHETCSLNETNDSDSETLFPSTVEEALGHPRQSSSSKTNQKPFSLLHAHLPSALFQYRTPWLFLCLTRLVSPTLVSIGHLDALLRVFWGGFYGLSFCLLISFRLPWFNDMQRPIKSTVLAFLMFVFVNAMVVKLLLLIPSSSEPRVPVLLPWLMSLGVFLMTFMPDHVQPTLPLAYLLRLDSPDDAYLFVNPLVLLAPLLAESNASLLLAPWLFRNLWLSAPKTTTTTTTLSSIISTEHPKTTAAPGSSLASEAYNAALQSTTSVLHYRLFLAALLLSSAISALSPRCLTTLLSILTKRFAQMWLQWAPPINYSRPDRRRRRRRSYHHH